MTSDLTHSGLDGLLARLAQDRDAAAAEYERIRRKLASLLEWWGSPCPEDDADEALDRVARKLAEGEPILRLEAYLHGVARRVLLESGRRRHREGAAAFALVPTSSPEERRESEARIACLERCLGELPAESRSLIVRYYRGAGKSHLEGRKLLANDLGIGYPTLKARAHRIRARLEECLRDCLGRDGRTIGAPVSPPVGEPRA